MTSSSATREVAIAHASDVHVDEGYCAQLFGGDGAGGLRAVLEAARREGADVVLLAGDTFECHRLSHATIENAARTMQAFDMPIVLLPGNHDPAIDEAVFHHPALARVDHLHILGVTHEDAVHLPHLDLEIWGRAHRDYHDMDPLAAVRERTTTWHVAMAHGHYTPAPDRSTRVRPSWLIGDDEITATRADYLALGHWNRRVAVGPGGIEAWYSGSPDYARSINIVRLGGAQRVTVSRAALDLPEGFGSGLVEGQSHE
jgi:DNA repair exonuclease SbcCD nuclease subunit